MPDGEQLGQDASGPGDGLGVAAGPVGIGGDEPGLDGEVLQLVLVVVGLREGIQRPAAQVSQPLVEADARGAVRDVDLDAVIAAYAAAPRELLTADQVAELIGAACAGSARHTLSRWGVTTAENDAAASGRVHARCDADQVRTAQRARPGRGHRTKPADS
ncbi:hypothetical protein ABIA33_007005 [Streptacidiphilus sp. MAP12-16]|uniref:hypothetical protein n=1 Tax=Streptacidiphilus sp. MAP12-16 TaxID=3156300 RepID=UPI0035193CB3